MKKEFKPIAMKCTEEQFEAIKPILEENGLPIKNIDHFYEFEYLTNNFSNENSTISNLRHSWINDYNRTVFEEWNQDIFLEYCGIEAIKTEKQTEKTMGYKLKVPVTDVLKIHNVACHDWKLIISRYLTRIDKNQEITFEESEIDAMFAAATTDQKVVLTEIFGEKKKEIDYDKLKTGSKVMIKNSGKRYGVLNTDLNKPFDIVFYKTPHYINSDGKFNLIGYHDSYITFYQEGKFVVFSSDTKINYITEVIEY